MRELNIKAATTAVPRRTVPEIEHRNGDPIRYQCSGLPVAYVADKSTPVL